MKITMTTPTYETIVEDPKDVSAIILEFIPNTVKVMVSHKGTPDHYSCLEGVTFLRIDFEET